MEKTNICENNQCYIVSLDNGIRTEEPVEIEVVKNFEDGSQLVKLNNTVFGVYKSNSLDLETMYIDDYEIIKADIAELLDIDHEETRRIVTEDFNIGVFTALNYRKNTETRISASSLLTEVVNDINNGTIKSEEVNWIVDTLQLQITSSGLAIKDEQSIVNIINLGYSAIIYNIEKKSGMPIEDIRKMTIKKNYIRMILFDFLIGRKHRGLDYYIVSDVDDLNNASWLNCRLGPISISNSISKDALVLEEEYSFNNFLIDRNSLIKVLFTYYYHEIKKVTSALNDATRLYKDAINRIIYNNTDVDKSRELEDLIDKNLFLIKEYQEKKDSELMKKGKINNVERTMATQTLNVKVTAKLDLIQKKYPINPKDHPELISNLRKPKHDKKRDQVELILENVPQKKAGFVSSAILLSSVALVCGIATGIIYVLITMGS